MFFASSPSKELVFFCCAHWIDVIKFLLSLCTEEAGVCLQQVNSMESKDVKSHFCSIVLSFVPYKIPNVAKLEFSLYMSFGAECLSGSSSIGFSTWGQFMTWMSPIPYSSNKKQSYVHSRESAVLCEFEHTKNHVTFLGYTRFSIKCTVLPFDWNQFSVMSAWAEGRWSRTFLVTFYSSKLFLDTGSSTWPPSLFKILLLLCNPLGTVSAKLTRRSIKNKCIVWISIFSSQYTEGQGMLGIQGRGPKFCWEK